VRSFQAASLDLVQPREDAAVLAQELRPEPRLGGDDGGRGGDPEDDESCAGGQRRSARVEPGDGAGEGCEPGVAEQRPPSCRRGVEAAEAVAARTPAPGERDPDPDREQDQQAERRQSAPARRGVRHERRGSAELHEREHERRRPDDPRRRSEIEERPARAVTIEQLRDAGHAEHGGEDQSTEEQEGRHLDQAASLATKRPPLPSQVAFR